MGEKLDFLVAVDSHNAVLEYEREYGQSSYRNIEVYKGKSLQIELGNVHVLSGPGSYGDSDLRKIEIFWEEAGIKNYRGLNLFGIYSCDYCRMSFDEGNKTLKIMSDNGITICIN